MKLLYIIFASSVVAGPILEKRYYDLDHDEILDWCVKDDILTTTSATVPATTLVTTTSMSSVAASTTSNLSASASMPTGTLPVLAESFASDNGSRWHISDVGSIYSSTLPTLGWDNGRTSVLNGVPFWNFGDVLSFDGLGDGFSTGPAFYGTPDDILRVDMKNVTNVLNVLLCPPDPSDPVPEEPTPLWGLSTSNVAEVSPGVGIGFVWVIWRDSTNLTSQRGLGMYRAGLGEEMPYGNRTGPLIAGPDALPVGIMTVFNAEGCIYTYTNKNGSGIVVGRAKVENAFKVDAYEFLRLDGTWVTGIPSYADAYENYGVEGEVHSDGQGSMMFSNYFEQYMFFTGSFASAMMFYTSKTPYGPFVGPYVLETIPGYGVNVHPFWSPNGSHKTLYVSSGVDNIIHMYKVEFDY